MASRTTFTGIVRSNGGDSKRETYAGSMVMAAQFYFLPTAAQGTDVQVSATDYKKSSSSKELRSYRYRI